MIDGYLGEIRAFAGHSRDDDWVPCVGQLLPVAQFATLFGLIQTTYGGDGVTNFRLPDLRNRVPLGAGSGPGLSSYALGQTGGQDAVALTVDQMSNHSHSFVATGTGGTSASPNGLFLGVGVYGTQGDFSVISIYNGPSSNIVAMHEASVDYLGSGAAHENRMPFVAMTYCICIQGEIPPRPGTE